MMAKSLTSSSDNKQESAMAATASLMKASQELAKKSPLVRRRTVSRDRITAETSKELESVESSAETNKMIMASARSAAATRSASATRRSSSATRRSSALNQLQNISSLEASDLSAEVAEITSRMESATVHSALEVSIEQANSNNQEMEILFKSLT